MLRSYVTLFWVVGYPLGQRWFFTQDSLAVQRGRPPGQLLKPQDIVPLCFRAQAFAAHRLAFSQSPPLWSCRRGRSGRRGIDLRNLKDPRRLAAPGLAPDNAAQRILRPLFRPKGLNFAL